MQDNDVRRKAFRHALINAGKTARQFAAEQGVTETHLYAVLRGERQSRPLESALASFIAASPNATAA